MTELHDALELARRLFGRVAARDWRSHDAIRMYVAQLGLVVREARRNPVAANEACRKVGIKGRRLEVRMVRLVAGKRVRSTRSLDGPMRLPISRIRQMGMVHHLRCEKRSAISTGAAASAISPTSMQVRGRTRHSRIALTRMPGMDRRFTTELMKKKPRQSGIRPNIFLMRWAVISISIRRVLVETLSRGSPLTTITPPTDWNGTGLALYG